MTSRSGAAPDFRPRRGDHQILLGHDPRQPPVVADDRQRVHAHAQQQIGRLRHGLIVIEANDRRGHELPGLNAAKPFAAAAPERVVLAVAVAHLAIPYDAVAARVLGDPQRAIRSIQEIARRLYSVAPLRHTEAGRDRHLPAVGGQDHVAERRANPLGPQHRRRFGGIGEQDAELFSAVTAEVVARGTAH